MLNRLRALDTFLPVTAIKYIYYRLRGKKIIAHQRAYIKGVKNITTEGMLFIGTSYTGFSHKKDVTFLNIRGKLIIKKNYEINRGCRIDIGPGAYCELGSGYINSNSTLIIMNGLRIGDNTNIAWGCEILDDDFHQIEYEGKIDKDKTIEIGNHVWIGSGVKILKGVKIGDNNIIASGAVVTKSFTDNNLLIAGNPAKVIKTNVDWK